MGGLLAGHGSAMPALGNKVRRVSLLAEPETTLAAQMQGDEYVVRVPDAALNPVATVIAIDVEGMPRLAE